MGSIAWLFSARGRSRRSEWWLLGIAMGISQTAISALIVRLAFGSVSLSMLANPSLEVLLVQIGVAALFVWPETALSLRRAHDRGSSGWMVWISLGLGWIQFGLEAAARLGELQLDAFTLVLLSLPSLAAATFLLVTLGFLEGDRGENRYGPSPKEGEDSRS